MRSRLLLLYWLSFRVAVALNNAREPAQLVRFEVAQTGSSTRQHQQGSSEYNRGLESKSVVEINEAGVIEEAGNRSFGGSAAGPTDACCMREKIKYQELPANQHNRTPAMSRAKIVFMCKKRRCPKRWRAVPGSFCTKGYRAAFASGKISAFSPAGLADPASCGDATVQPDDMSEEDEDEGLDYDPNALPINVCCVHTNHKDGRWTKVRMECKSRPCWTKGGWKEASGDICASAFTLAQQAGMKIQAGDTFCKSFDGTTNSKWSSIIRRRRSL